MTPEDQRIVEQAIDEAINAMPPNASDGDLSAWILAYRWESFPQRIHAALADEGLACPD